MWCCDGREGAGGELMLVTQWCDSRHGWWAAEGRPSMESFLKLALINLIVKVLGRVGGNRPQTYVVRLMEGEVIKYNLTACCAARPTEIRKLSSERTIKMVFI